jgi:hypothetical protein
MDKAIAADDKWGFHNPRAELRAGALCGHLDVSRPELGVSRLSIDRQQVSGHIFGIFPGRQPNSAQGFPSDKEHSELLPRQLADTYVRGGDLVAVYQPTVGWPYATQVYWQINDTQDSHDLLCSLSLLVSLHTHLLDTWPTICIHTQLMADEVVQLKLASEHSDGIRVLPNGISTLRSATGDCCILYRLAQVPFTYVEMMPAGDMRELSILRSDDRTCHARWELFAEFLEKGVIRRAQMQAIVVPRACDTELARAAYNAMQRRPLPLTT